MKEYGDFFRFTSHAYFVAYVIYMAGVFDKGREKDEDEKQTISFPPLIREMRATQQLSGRSQQ
jgi:hypothetical protein